MKGFLKSFSYLFHPIVIPTITYLLSYLITKRFYYPYEVLITLTQIVLMTFLLPITIYFLLKSMLLLNSSIMVNNTKERVIPIAIFIVLLFSLKDYILKESLTYEYNIYLLGTILTYTILLISVFFKKKNSVHIASLSGCITFFILISAKYLYSNIAILIILVLILGLTATSRLYLKAHTSREIIFGFIIGVIPQILIWQTPYYKVPIFP